MVIYFGVSEAEKSGEFAALPSLETGAHARDMAALPVPQIERRKLQSGDLVFFGARDAVSHVGIYVGENRFVHAPTTGGTVRLDALDGPYWKERYLFAKRVLR